MHQHTHIYKCTRTHLYTDRLEIYVCDTPEILDTEII